MIRWSPVFGPVLLLASASAVAAEWRMDPATSRLEFQASYQGEPVPGAFKRFDTRFRFDSANPQHARLEVTVQLPSVDFGSVEINDAVREPEWLDLGRFAEATFISTDIERTAPDRYLARGTLGLKGSARPVAVPFTWQPAGNAATMRGEVTVKRTDFGIGTGEWESGDLIGVDVKVMFDVRLRAG